jgi:hypothetical protein
MTVSINELVFELLELRRAFLKDTDPLSKRIVIDWIQTCRARLLEQKFNKPMASIDDHYVQVLSPILMEKVSSNDSSLGLVSSITARVAMTTITDYTYMYRTNVNIPRVIASYDGKGVFTRIGPADKLSEKFTVTTYEKALTSGNGKFNHNSIYAFPLGDRICLYSKSGIHFGVKYIYTAGVFQDAITAAKLQDPTWTYDSDYPINKEMIDQLKVLIINEKFGLTLIQAGDKTDDQNDNPEGNTLAQKRLPVTPQQNVGL